MPRANRYLVPGRIWHITHRCHERTFLLKFVRDRRRYLRWLFEAKKRFGLCILDYAITSNHIHLLLKDRDDGIARQHAARGQPHRTGIQPAQAAKARSGRIDITPPRSTPTSTCIGAWRTST